MIFFLIFFVWSLGLLANYPSDLRINQWVFEKQRFFFAMLDAEDGTKWLLKKSKQEQQGFDLIAIICEKIGADIANQIGVHVPQVCIFRFSDIANGAPFFRCSRFVSVHEWIETEKRFDMQDGLVQRAFMPWQQEYGKVAEEEQGFTMRVLNVAAQHSDLCAIAVLDLFLGNYDRRDDNLLFDEKNNVFWAIDFELIFSKPLAKKALFHVKKLISDTIVLKEFQLHEMKKCLNLLKQLVDMFPPKTVSKMIKDIGVQLDIVDLVTGKFTNIDVWRELKRRKRNFYVNYFACKELILAIEEYFKFLERESPLA